MIGGKMQISTELLVGFIGIFLTIFIEGCLTSNKFGRLEANVNELKTKQDKHNNLIERMVIVEQSTKSAHHRIDNMEEKCNENIRTRFIINKEK